jgi:phage terminase large subunit GpA-like protein
MPLRRSKPLNRSGKLNPRGKKVKAWDDTRRKLKREFFKNGIVRCEMCGSSEMLSFAHRRKRRFITDEKELATVALLCLRHHDEIERKSHEEMYRIITEIIKSRETRL